MPRLGLIAAGVLAAAVAGAVVAAAVGAQQPGERAFTFIGRGGATAVLDTPPRQRGAREGRLSAGDAFLVTQPLFDEAGTRVGAIRRKCTALTRGRRPVFHCEGTYVLGDGTIAISAAFKGGEEFLLAVLGGTGAYEGARGSVALEPGDAEGSERNIIHLLP
jgi:hypothetical protein